MEICDVKLFVYLTLFVTDIHSFLLKFHFIIVFTVHRLLILTGDSNEISIKLLKHYTSETHNP